MTQKFVVRLMDDQQQMLAWVAVQAVSRPQRPRAGSCPFFAPEPSLFVIEQAGTATKLLIHWCDLDVVRTVPIMEPVEVAVGQVFRFLWVEPVWLVHGERDIVLPAVTVRYEPVVIGVPTGNLGVVGQPV